NEIKKYKSKEELIIFDYFHGVSSLEKVTRFLEETIKPNKKYFVFPFMGGRFYSNSFIEIFELLKSHSQITLVNWDEMIQKIISGSAQTIYRKNSLLIGTSYLDKLLALHGQTRQVKLEGEILEKIPYGNECHVEIV